MSEVDAIDVDGTKRILFFDLAELEESDNIEQVVCEATKHVENPVLPLGYAHEFDSLAACMWGGGSALYDRDQEQFRIWYHAHGREYHPDDGGRHEYSRRTAGMCYAHSKDGVHFVKPNLGLHEFGGSRDNNIVSLDQAFCPVVMDATQPDPDKRYAAFVVGLVGPSPQDDWVMELSYSPDGLNWRNGPEVYRGSIEVRDHIDRRSVLIDERDPDPNRRYKVYGQGYADELDRSMPSGYRGELQRRKVRDVGLWYGPDLEHMVPHAGNPVLHPNTGEEHEIHFCSVTQYHDFYVMLYEHDWYDAEGHIIGDIRLAYSHDGLEFTRLQPEHPVIPVGAKGEWDGGMLVTSPIVVEHDGRLWIYYTGVSRDWKGWPSARPKGAPSPSTIYPQHLGLATLPSDGFVRLQTRNRPMYGWFRTVPLRAATAPLRVAVNVETTRPGRSWVSVEALDAVTNLPLPGYVESDCLPVTEDGLEVPVRWKGDRDRIETSSPVKLHVAIHGEAELRALVVTG